MMMTSGDFTLTGFSSDTAIANAANGTFAMSSGEVFGYGESDNGKVIISKALADFNDLKVGDEITVTNPFDTSTTYTFTISGIYKNSTSSNTSAMGPMGGTSQDADNAIYTSVSTLKSLGLDADTTGVLLITNDGQFNHRMTSPKHKVAKLYQVGLKHAADADLCTQLRNGVLLHDDNETVHAAAAELADSHTLLLTITEGKYHQVKRMVAAAGNRVESLHRLRFGTWECADLAPGQWRFIQPDHTAAAP